MNTIRNYLDNMFRNLPNTDAVRKAKAELLQMMEDKYEELIKEGKTENEAIGIVISEFGNLDELADSLGIGEQITESADENKPILSMDRIRSYLGMINQRALLIPIGIALCICCVAAPIIADSLPVDVLGGVGGMFSMIAVAVVLFVLAGIKNKDYPEVRKKECSLSVEGAEYVRNERSSFKSSYGMMSSIGIGLCILSILNPMIFDKIPYLNSNFGAAMMFGFIGLGVFLITYAHTKMKGYDRLLELNVGMGEEFVPKADRKVNKLPIVICALIVAGVMITSMGTRFVLPFFTGVFIKDDIANTIATTYGQNEEGGSMGDFKGEISSVKLDLSACTVNFEQAEGSGLVGVEYTGGSSLKPEVTFENGKLAASQKNSFNLNFMKINSPKLTIKLGKDVNLSSLEMKVNAGDISIKGANADYFYGNFDAGNISINDCSFRKAEVTADAGNIQISGSSAKILKIKTDAGNIDVRNTAFDDLDVKSDFGSVNISGVEDIDGYDIDCKVDAGIVQVGNAAGGRKYSAKGTGKGSIKIDVDAGNIKID